MLDNKVTREAPEIDKNGVTLGKLPGYLGYRIRQAQTAVFRDFSSTGKDLGITPGEFSLLTMVHENPGIHQISLVRVHRLDKSTLSNSITKLKKRKLLKRVRDDEDRRYYGLWLTSFGLAVLTRATERIEAQEGRIDSVLKPGERAQLLDMLSRIAKALDRPQLQSVPPQQ